MGWLMFLALSVVASNAVFTVREDSISRDATAALRTPKWEAYLIGLRSVDGAQPNSR